MREAMSRLADATAVVAGRVVGAAVEGVINGTRGAADAIRNGWHNGSQSVAGRPDTAWAGVVGGIQGATKRIRDERSTGGQSRRRSR